MKTKGMVPRDERTDVIENQSYGLAYKTMGIMLLLDVMYRSLWLREAAWDLLGIVVLGGLVAAGYQIRRDTWGVGRTALVVMTFLLGMIVALAAASVAQLYGLW